MRLGKLIELLQQRTWQNNVPFHSVRLLLKRFGFLERIHGSHHIFSKPGVIEILNLQSAHGKAKPYQLKQIRDVLWKYGMIGKSP